ncbi:MAG: FAD-binding oxidoreductase [Candidatus Eremiobacteraeota bacterium]|nr:FAD-binding oxidoreductase [Candidatus Eremiobacteraeota bacterium]MCW5869264.1 FAD-binding oxidoreductase [Candidatus Eremiobacteraeota bacterium]
MKIRPEKQTLSYPPLVTAPLGELLASQGDPFSDQVRDVFLYNKYTPQKAASLTELRQQGVNLEDLQCLTDLPALSADGLSRTRVHYASPATLRQLCEQRDWEKAPDGTPIADVVVVGAGPGGLATSYHLAQKGARVVTLEAGYAAQAFSDAGAPCVHSMRTDRLLTSLVRTGYALEDLSTVMGLPAGLGQIVAHASQARKQLWDATGHRIRGLPEKTETTDRYQPAARAELFEHFQQVANYLAAECPNSFLLERAPVTRLGRSNDLFCIETEPGHKLYARKLVMATGLVQEGGSNAKSLPLFAKLAGDYPSEYLLLQKDADLVEQAGPMREERQWIVNDRLLGRSEIKLALHRLPGQARVAVVGSGESAIKAALEVLSQNPTLKVDLFTKSPLEVAQVQVPGENFHPVVLEHAQGDPAYAQFSKERFRHFDTPVTPRSMIEALEEVGAGRLRIHELGSYFDESSVELGPDGKGRSSIAFVNPEVRTNLRKQREEWAKYGLKQAEVERVDNVAMMIQATGYSREKLPLHPLAQQLVQAGLVKLEEGQPKVKGFGSAVCRDLVFNSSMLVSAAADSAIPGMAVRGRHVAESLVADLPERPLPPQAEPSQNPGADWAHGYSREDFEGFVRYRGLAPNWVESQGGPQDTPSFHFPDPERFLRELDERDPASLRPAEKIALERAHRLRLRMGTPEFEVSGGREPT